MIATRFRDYLLAFAACVCAAPAQQDDWSTEVEKACTHRRYAVRRAVANKIATAGDAAVPALRAFMESKGPNALPLLIVDAIAREDSTRGDAVAALLATWADDREFFWRSQALGGLATRHVEASRARFVAGLDDPSHLYRVQSARGLLELGDHAPARELLNDPDPRVRVRVADLLARAGDDAGYEQLVAAIPRRALTFLGDPWAERELMLVTDTFSDLAGKKFDLGVEPLAPELDRMRAWAAAKCDRPLPARELIAPIEAEGGIEIRSCRHGDLFVRWNGRELIEGLEGEHRTPLEPAAWAELRGRLGATLPENGIEGRVVCDFLRLRSDSVEKHVKFAPQSLPGGVANWLSELAYLAEESSAAGLSAALLARLPQFAGSDPK